MTVIINCFNGEKYLREAINSVLAQTYENWEIIFWDNQSTDSTREIVQGYEDERIHYYYAPEHTNLGEARNQAMKKANGDYIAFLDSDDWWAPDFLSEGVSVIQQEHCAVYYTNYFEVIGQEKKVYNKNTISGVQNLKEVLDNYKIGMSANIIDNSIIHNNNLQFDPDFQLIEDYDFFIKLGLCGDYYYNSNPTSFYRNHSDSTSYIYRDGWYKEVHRLYTTLKEKYKNNGEETLFLKPIRSNMEHYHAAELVHNNDRKGLLLLLLKNLDMPDLWGNFMYVLFGRDLYNKIRKRESS